MTLTNVEIKARCSDPEAVRDALRAGGAVFHGRDRQVDTYFEVRAGRLKLREGEIENGLIFYRREDRAGPKRSDVVLWRTGKETGLKSVLAEALGVRVVVDKEREIWFIGNVKFHVDRVGDLGSFVEIEAIDSDGTIGVEKLREQCDEYLDLFGIRPEDLVATSYADLLE